MNWGIVKALCSILAIMFGLSVIGASIEALGKYLERNSNEKS